MNLTKIQERFILEEPLGEGRFAVVYRAQDLHLEHPVAFKLLREEHIDGDPKWREAFDIEVDLLRKMADVPTAMTMLDHGMAAEGRPYITLELLPTGTDLLSRVTQQGGFPEAEGVSILWQLTDLLRIAHARDIAYRDMKLEHIFWLNDRMILIDWNVSRQYSPDGPYDGFDLEWEKERSFQDDLFKLGTMFYSIFTGLDIRDRQVPTPVYSQLEKSGFSLTDEGIVWPIDFGDAPLSPEMKDTIRRLVHIDPDQRFQTASAVCEALEDHAERLDVELVRPANSSEALPGAPWTPVEGWLAQLYQKLAKR